MSRWILPLALTAVAGLSLAEDKPAERPKPEPDTTPLELTITGKTTKYTLETGGQSSADYAKQVEEAGKGGRPTPTPVIDLAAEIKNTSDKPIQVWTTGDPVLLTLTVKGKGALNLDPPIAFTEEFRLPKAVEIEAGKTHTIPLKSLTSGFRSRSHYSYWTEPGEHEIVATLKTGVSPAPKGAKETMDGFGTVMLTSPAFRVAAEEKK